MKGFSSSARQITEAATSLYDEIVNRNLLVRRIYLTVNHVVNEDEAKRKEEPRQLNLFDDVEEIEKRKKRQEAELAKERKIQEAQIAIKERFGNNAILKGINFEEGATAKERNAQIGGHKA